MKAALVSLIAFTLCFSQLSSQAVGDYRSVATGNWNNLATWETWNGSAWVAPGVAPSNANGVITIQSPHTVTINVNVTFDQVVVNSGATLLSVPASVVTIANSGITASELVVDGIYVDGSNTSVVWNAGATWNLGPNGTLRKTTGSSSNNWQSFYEGGITNIPATSNWVLRKQTAQNPSLSTTGAYYGNLIIENMTGTAWVAPASSTFQGTGFATIKGNFDLGGTGITGITFANNQTNIQPTLVMGNVTIRTGNIFQNYGTGLEIQGNLTNNGTISYDANDARKLVFSGGIPQSITNTGTLGIYDFIINKSSFALSLNNSITVDNLATFTSGVVNSTLTNLFIFNTAATVTGANNTSYVNGPARKLGSAGITFPVGKSGQYRPLGIGNGIAVASVNIYTYDFNSGANGWTLNQTTGAEGADANFFTISGNEGGTQSTFPPSTAGIVPNLGSPSSCGTVNANATLHVTSVFNPTGGAAYDAGGLCGLLFCPQSNRQSFSPLINTTGFSGLELAFDYIENGQTTFDNASVYYSSNGGALWVLLDDMPKTLTACGGQGVWVTRTLPLPATCDNNPNVRIAFRWVNNDDGAGTDPSFAVDNVIVRQPAPVNSFTAEYFPTNPQVPYGNVLVPTLTALSDCEYWILTRDLGTDSRTVTLSWNAASCYNTAYASFQVARWDNISSVWQDHDGTVVGTAAGGTVTTPAVVTSFSPFAIAYVPLPLPVEMESMSIDCEDGNGVLNWQTASEINNDHFAIERSIDAANWQEIDRVAGNGNSNVSHSYSWVDLDPLSDGYYRIKQVDFDGLYKTYDPLSLHCISKNNWVTVYPNPSSGTVNIEISQGSHLEAVMIYNSLGQFTNNASINGMMGKATLPIDISFLEPGTYYLRLLVNGEWLTRPVVIIK